MPGTRYSTTILSFFFVGAMSIGANVAEATFHFMQIEQVMGGVNGDVSAQAIQLRMRDIGQHFVEQGRLIAWDAAGANPVLLINIPTNLTGPSATGDRILIATSSFASKTTPTAVPDFIMAPIPADYLPAGSLTFEDDFDTIYWRLSWGGASYSGSTTGDSTNDDDPGFGPADFGPPFAGSLPSERCQALQFKGAATALSTTNSADYAVTTAASVWAKYHGASYTISLCVPAVSAWGLVVMILTLLTAATLLIARRRSVDLGSAT
jgi:hypothetical protein